MIFNNTSRMAVKFEHVYFLPDKEQNMTDRDFDSSQVDNAKIEIMMVVEKIKQLLTCEQRQLVVLGFCWAISPPPPH